MIALRRALVAIGVLGVALALAMSAVIWGSDRLDESERLLMAFLILPGGLSFLGTGLFAWWRRPENSVGPLMVAVGFSWLLNGSNASDEAWLFTFGLVSGALPYAFLIHLLLVYPDGRLESIWDRRLVALSYFTCTVMTVLPNLFQIPGDVETCNGCPDNLVLVTRDQALGDVAVLLLSLTALTVLTGLAITLVRRWRRWPQVKRSALAPVLWTGGAGMSLVVLGLVIEVFGGKSNWVTIAGLLPLACVPFAFLLGLLRTRLSSADALSSLVGALREPGSRSDLRVALAAALDDEDLRLAYWVPSGEAYVDSDGAWVDTAVERPGRAWTAVAGEAAPVAAIDHRELDEDEKRHLDAVLAAAKLALENERLEAELRARLKDLESSRARIVEAGYAERKRVERDLHDGAQQRLVGLALNLRLAKSMQESDPEGAAAILDEASEELTQATEELRELARGIHPAVLTSRGLPAAIKALAARAPLPVEVDTRVEGRLPEPVEAAAYFVAAEALTNVARHSGAAGATVRAVTNGSSLIVEVVDDGNGEVNRQGSGLRGLADRVSALGGSLEVSGREGGTTLRAVIPTAADSVAR
jgi:signal transduction histidine kinase